MELNSKYPLHGEASNSKQHQDCDCQSAFGNKVIFENSYGNFGPLDITFADGELLQTFNQPISSVTIDTTCVDVKNLIIDFTGILNVTTTVAATSTLTFILYRICKDRRQRQTISSVNFFVADTTGDVTTSHTLAFKFPIWDDNCNGCCTYVLGLTSVSNADFGTINYSINGNLSALAIVAAN